MVVSGRGFLFSGVEGVGEHKILGVWGLIRNGRDGRREYMFLF
jgi:hypothetical protein